MGEPLKIVNLTMRMIHLRGFSHKEECNPAVGMEREWVSVKKFGLDALEEPFKSK